MADTLQLLGTFLNANAGRDAVHVAVAPVIAAHVLNPGEHVGWMDDEREKVGRVANTIGIVDPFIRTEVHQGARFFLLLYPTTITSLRHVWEHPAFRAEGVKSKKRQSSERWLRDFCAQADCPGYEEVMELIQVGKLPPPDGYTYPSEYSGDALHFTGSDCHGEIPPEFWTHVEIVLDRKLDKKPTHFSCSC